MELNEVIEMINSTGMVLNDRNINYKVVVFGGSGFLGHALIERLLLKGHNNITAVARNEGGLVALKEKFPSVTIQVGDIADTWTVKKAMVAADEVYLLSALKHVGIAETDVRSCVETNIVGHMNVINESLITKPKVLMFISSDKAAQGTGVYGMSKKIGEKLMLEAEKINPDTMYRTVRYGNVLYSSGSVLCKWRDKMVRGEEVIVTDLYSTRFYWPVSEAVDLIFKAVEADNADPVITPMKSMMLCDLLEAMMEKYGKVPVKVIGLQPGENMHEVIAEGIPDSFHSERFTKEEIFELI
jgi:UDP-N-acetylglucosamine 4,6-dehydratase/5-epimerase